MTYADNAKRLLGMVVFLGAILGLVACEIKDTFKDDCVASGGSVLSDSTTKTVSTYSNGGVGIGSTTVTVRLCIVDGDVTAMEVW